MRRYTIFFLLASVVAGFASCNNVDITPDNPEQPSVSKYEQLTFSTADDDAAKAATRAVWSDPNGKGNLIFNWEEDNAGTEVVAMLTGEDSFIPNYPSENPSADELNDIKYHSYMTISPQEDLHKADFKTVRYYNKEDKDAAKAVYAVTPVNDFCIFEADETSFSAQMEMPASFVQSFSQTPEFLRDYMMMYAQATVVNGSATLNFKHIPATFRFIITNKRPTTARLENVSLSIDGGAPIGSNFAEVHGDYTTESLYVDFAGNHTSITTLLNTTLASQESYTAYAMALPLSDGETLEGKDIKFVINTAEHGFLSFVLKGEQVAGANPGGEYNWVSGKSYTIRMSLNDVLTFESITVKDWTQEEIEGGEAEEDEWPNGINIYTGEYQPATLNAAGAYEIANVGNLMWFNQQVTASDVDNTALNAVLTADVDLEGFKWAALGRSSDKPYMGTFDGRGHTISNLSRNAHSNEGSRESFAYYLGAEGVIKNVTFDNADVFCQGHAGANASAVVALRSAGTISCCVVSNAHVQLGNYEYLSGIAGVNNGTIENCAVINTSLTRRFGHSHPSAPITHNNQGTVRNCFAYGCTQSADNAANGGIVVSSSTVPANCYYYTTSSVSDAYGTAKIPAEFASVTMAELLNADQENAPWEYVTGNDYPTLKK